MTTLTSKTHVTFHKNKEPKQTATNPNGHNNIIMTSLGIVDAISLHFASRARSCPKSPTSALCTRLLVRAVLEALGT